MYGLLGLYVGLWAHDKSLLLKRRGYSRPISFVFISVLNTNAMKDFPFLSKPDLHCIVIVLYLCIDFFEMVYFLSHATVP